MKANFTYTEGNQAVDYVLREGAHDEAAREYDL